MKMKMAVLSPSLTLALADSGAGPHPRSLRLPFPFPFPFPLRTALSTSRYRCRCRCRCLRAPTPSPDSYPSSLKNEDEDEDGDGDGDGDGKPSWMRLRLRLLLRRFLSFFKLKPSLSLSPFKSKLKSFFLAPLLLASFLLIYSYTKVRDREVPYSELVHAVSLGHVSHLDFEEGSTCIFFHKLPHAIQHPQTPIRSFLLLFQIQITRSVLVLGWFYSTLIPNTMPTNHDHHALAPLLHPPQHATHPFHHNFSNFSVSFRASGINCQPKFHLIGFLVTT